MTNPSDRPEREDRPWGFTDNTNPEVKVRIREQALERLEARPRVLDLFCGAGAMYEACYRDRAKEYIGIDRQRVHDPSLCLLIDNETYVAHHDLARFDVFDLDDYGCPWALLYRVLAKAGKERLTVFLTDGLIKRVQVNSKPPRIVAATNRVPKSMRIPALARLYHPMFATMLLEAESRYGYHTDRAIYALSDRKSVYYWSLELSKKPSDQGAKA